MTYMMAVDGSDGIKLVARAGDMVANGDHGVTLVSQHGVSQYGPFNSWHSMAWIWWRALTKGWLLLDFSYRIRHNALVRQALSPATAWQMVP